ncbi:MAG: cytochrome [Rhodospirillales bacterium]|nr:cytochrome [Rhodospirillales bacterium]
MIGKGADTDVEHLVDLATVNLLDTDLLNAPYTFYTQLRRDAPVWRVPGTRVFLVARWDLVVDAAARLEDFSSNLTGILVRGTEGRPELLEFPPDIVASAAIATADPPAHTIHRKLAQPSLSPITVAKMEPAVVEAVDRLLSPLLARGGGEVMATLANPLPALVIAWVLGLPPGDADRIMKWGVQGGDLLHGTRTAQEIVQILPETEALSAYLDDQLLKAATRGDDVGTTGQLARMIAEGATDRLTARNILLVLIGAAVETTMSLIGNTLRLLIETPGLEVRIRRDRTLIPALIEESARLESPFKGHYRVVRRPCHLGDVALEPGDRLQLLWASANRDETVIADADRIDLSRPNPRRHLAYGHGLHFCLGAALARQEVRVVLERLLARTTRIASGDDGAELIPSLFVRRLDRLDVRFVV